MQTVKPGEWVSLQVPSGSWPVHIKIERFGKRPAFIDNKRGDDGQVYTLASIRCPDIPAGRHNVAAIYGDGRSTDSIKVLR